MWPWSHNRAARYGKPLTAEERERCREIERLAEERGRESLRIDAEHLLEDWVQEHPLRLWHVFYALADGRVTNQHNPERVRAHRWCIEAIEGSPSGATVFMFLKIEPVSDGYAVEEKATAILVIPFDRVHSINLQPEQEEEE